MLRGDPREDPRAEARGRARHRDDEARVVDELPVPSADAGDAAAVSEVLHADGGSKGPDCGRAQRRGGRQQRCGRAHTAAQGIAERVTCSDEGTARAGVGSVQRQHLGERPGQVRRDAGHQQVALRGALVRDPDLPGREVAQPPVHEFRGPAARARREVTAFDEDGAQAARRGIQCHARTGDAASDDEHIDLGAVRDLVELSPPPRGIQCGRSRRPPAHAHHPRISNRPRTAAASSVRQLSTSSHSSTSGAD